MTNSIDGLIQLVHDHATGFAGVGKEVQVSEIETYVETLISEACEQTVKNCARMGPMSSPNIDARIAEVVTAMNDAREGKRLAEERVAGLEAKNGVLAGAVEFWKKREAALAAQGAEPVAEWVKSPIGDYPLLVWERGYEAKIGDKLYDRPPAAEPSSRAPDYPGEIQDAAENSRLAALFNSPTAAKQAKSKNTFCSTLEIMAQLGKKAREKQQAEALKDATGLPVEQEPKYTVNGSSIVNRSSGEPIPADEPVFVFRARDRHSREALEAYACVLAPGEHRDAVCQRITDFADFSYRSPERMKEPDTAAIASAEGGL